MEEDAACPGLELDDAVGVGLVGEVTGRVWVVEAVAVADIVEVGAAPGGVVFLVSGGQGMVLVEEVGRWKDWGK